jgi:hypothetical protein
LLARLAIPEDFGVVQEDAAATVFVAGDTERFLLEAAAPELEPGAQGEFMEGDQHGDCGVE